MLVLNVAAPSVVARSWQADDSENETKGQGRLCADDSTHDARLGVALGKALACETKPGGTKEREQKADGGGQDLHSRLQLLDRAQELLAILLERFEGDDGAQATTLPGGHGRAREVQAVAQRPRTCATHVLSEAVVVGAPVRPREAPVSSREDRRAGHQGKRAESGILSDIQHAELAYRFVRNVLAFSWAVGGRFARTGPFNLTLCADVVSIGIGIRKRGSTFPVRFVLGLVRDRNDQDGSVGFCSVDDRVGKPVHQVSPCTVSVGRPPQRGLDDSTSGGLVLQTKRFSSFPIALPVPAARRSELQSCFWMDSKLIGRAHRSR